MAVSIVILYCISLGPQPVGVQGVQCRLTSSLGEFSGYWNWSGILGYYPRWCPSRLSPTPSVSLCFFYSLFTCHWISFVFLLYNRRICTHSIDPILADGEFPGLGLALVPHVVVPEAEHGVRMKQKSRFKFLPLPGFEPQTLQSNGRKRYR